MYYFTNAYAAHKFYKKATEDRKVGEGMTGFTNTSELVKDILTNNPSSRNSDNTLFYLVCKTILDDKGIDIKDMRFEMLLFLKDYGLPQFETVGRIRRKLQQDMPELACCGEVAMHRALNADSFRNYTKEGD